MFVLYARSRGRAPRCVYRGLPRAHGRGAREAPAPLTQSKQRVYTLAALFSLDAFGGGFVVQSMVALWLYQRHGVSLGDRGHDLLLDRRPLGDLVSSSRCASPSASGS